MHEIAIRVHLQPRERLSLADYERLVGSVASLSALVGWLPTPEARLVLRGRGAEPVRIETVSYGDTSEILIVLDRTDQAVEKAATAVAALLGNVSPDALDGDPSGVAGELERLDRAAPRGRSAAQRSIRAFLEGARADVVARRTTARVRAASALVRLAEDGASVTVERVEDPQDPILEETVVAADVPTGDTAVVGAAQTPAEPAGSAIAAVEPTGGAQKAGGELLPDEQDAPVLTEKSQKAKGSKFAKKSGKKSTSASAKESAKGGKPEKSGKSKKSDKKDKKKSKKK